MKHRLLETLPTFVLPGDKYAIVNVASKLSVSRENMRQCQQSKRRLTAVTCTTERELDDQVSSH
jgi:hypothetical protein